MGTETKSDRTRAAIYCRVSTDGQAGEDKTSLEDQETRGRQYAAAKGWKVVSVYVDPGVSASKPLSDRDAGAQLIAAAFRGEFDRLVVTKIDRFTRSLLGGLNDLERLKEYGVGLVSIGENFDTGTTPGRAMLALLMVFATFERETINERMAGGRLRKAGASKWPGGNVAFGYRVTDGGFVEVEDTEAEAVALIFQLVASGNSSTTVAAEVNTRGYRTRPRRERGAGPDAEPARGKFGASMVSRIVTRESYRGESFVWNDPKTGDEVGTIAMPAIVSAEIWEAANRVIALRRLAHAKKQPKAGDGRVYGLAGRIFHSHAEDWEAEESALVPMQGQSKQKTYALKFGEQRVSYDRRYYVCRRPRTGEKSTCPGIGETPERGRPTKALQAAGVEAGVLLWGLALLDDPDRLAEYVAAYDREVLGAGDEAEALKLAVQELEVAEAGVARILRFVRTDVITEGQADEELALLKAQRDEAAGVIERLRIAKAKSEAVRFSIEYLMTAEVVEGWLPEDVEPSLPLSEGDDWKEARLLAPGRGSRRLAAGQRLRLRSGEESRGPAPRIASGSAAVGKGTCSPIRPLGRRY